VVPKLPNAKPLTTPQGPIAHVARDSDFPTAINAQLPAGALGAAAFSKYASVSPAARQAQEKILTTRRLQSAAISRLAAPALPSITSTAMQFSSASNAKATGNGVYTLRELQSSAGSPISATAVTTLLTSLINR
jgi:hypothetical protein